MGGSCSTQKLHRSVAAPVEDRTTGDCHADDLEKDPQAAATDGDAPPVAFRAKRRHSVSAEVSSLSLTEGQELKVIEKSDEAKARIRVAMQHSFLLKVLEEEQEKAIVDAMFERTAEAGEVIIRESEEGDNFYIIESGDYAVTKGDRQVFKYEGHGAFGELALMYNCPRAATVEAVTPGVLWAVDRVTFRAIVVTASVARRQRLEDVLTTMPIFSSLTAEQRAAVADCLEVETWSEGEYILREGDALGSDAKFYLVESGTVRCVKSYEGDKKEVATISDGGFFGEVALVTHAPRAADCIAASEKVKLLSMGRDAFERLMGPVEETLAEKIKEYEAVDARVRTGSLMPAEAPEA